MGVPSPPLDIRSKLSIILWGLIGAVAGWLVAAISFLNFVDEGTCLFLALATMLLPTLYGARRHRRVYPRVVWAILGGGLLLALLAPSASHSYRDRLDVMFSKRITAVSHIPCGLGGGLLFLSVLIGMAPAIQVGRTVRDCEGEECH